jgi:hypothetical protein
MSAYGACETSWFGLARVVPSHTFLIARMGEYLNMTAIAPQ